jgi:hypothetical protein
MRDRIILFVIGASSLVIVSYAAESDLQFFETKVRPVLVENCYKCHSVDSEKIKGGLRLDSRESILKGGDSGPAIVPGDPEKSLLIAAVRYTDKELQMPPKNKKLPDRQIADITTWVKNGAPWPKDDKAKSARTNTGFQISEKDRSYWAFQRIQRPPVPEVKQRSWLLNPIDAFVLTELESKGLKPNQRATRRELIRRAYFDLIGLPPTPEEVAAFEKDRSPNAFEKVVEDLLARPQYGERWGRHWLDVARFAQSNGYERDGEKPLAWRYRDYVIAAFNEDKPYDRFIIEQLAGDELPDATRDSIIATGFQRLGVWDDEPDDKRMAEFDELDDIISTTSGAFLGLTLSCARCHDHKFDPISQTDYYQFLAFFRNVRPSEAPKYTLDSANYLPLDAPEKIKTWSEERDAKIKALERQLEAAKENQKALREAIKKTKEDTGAFEWALGVRERKPVPTHLLIRGNAGSPGPEVQAAFLTVLGGNALPISRANSRFDSCGRRLTLARWIASSENPLTARVMVNRIWQHHFGRGIVKTTTDFGRAGTPPSNPKLLDWLASEFIRCGCSVKKLHRVILMSNAYQMSSRCEDREAERVDPGNDLLWRQNLRRLEAEAIRDGILTVSGELNLKMGGRGFFPHLAGEVLAGASRPGLDWQKTTIAEQSRRSIYSYIRRTMLIPANEAFDYSNTTSPLGERPITTVAPQALMLLNDDFVQHQAKSFASRIRREAGQNRTRQLRRAYHVAFGRDPEPGELRTGLEFLQRQARTSEAFRSRVTFSPDTPNSLSVEYMKQLEPVDFLMGPREGWNYFRGYWFPNYEGIRSVDRGRGPFALWNGATFADGVVEAKLTLQPASEFASLLFRANAEGDEQLGYELRLDPRQQKVALRCHTTNVVTLAESEAAISTAKSMAVKVELAGARIRVWLNGDTTTTLDWRDSMAQAAKGLVGVRTCGGPLSIDDFAIVSDRKRFALGSKDTGSATERGSSSARQTEDDALQSFCLLLLNLNEMIYID